MASRPVGLRPLVALVQLLRAAHAGYEACGQTLAKGPLATGAARKKAIGAVARQLAVDLWRLRTGQL